jgi:glycosyltransferase involved in cell wall biosynthesis
MGRGDRHTDGKPALIMPTAKPSLEIWSPLPPTASGVADYVHEQLSVLDENFALTLVVSNPGEVESELLQRFRVVGPSESDGETLRVYHIGNSPAHNYVYTAALGKSGVVVLHEWNLHELVLGQAVTAKDFRRYHACMRREHGERGAVAAGAIASALGGKHWTSVFPLNADVLENALAIVALSGSTASRAAGRVPGTPLFHLPHHCLLKARTAGRSEARVRLGLNGNVRMVLAPGLGTSSKSLDVAREALLRVRRSVPTAQLVTVGGESDRDAKDFSQGIRTLGRVDLETLGDAIRAADVVLALRFPSRGEASGVVMRSLAAGRALVVSSGSSADEDLPEGVVARVNPGPAEMKELAAALTFLLTDNEARGRMEQLALEVSKARDVGVLTEGLAGFLCEIMSRRSVLESRLVALKLRATDVRDALRNEVEAAASSLGLTQPHPRVFERLTGW